MGSNHGGGGGGGGGEDGDGGGIDPPLFCLDSWRGCSKNEEDGSRFC